MRFSLPINSAKRCCVAGNYLGQLGQFTFPLHRLLFSFFPICFAAGGYSSRSVRPQFVNGTHRQRQQQRQLSVVLDVNQTVPWIKTGDIDQDIWRSFQSFSLYTRSPVRGHNQGSNDVTCHHFPQGKNSPSFIASLSPSISHFWINALRCFFLILNLIPFVFRPMKITRLKNCVSCRQ